MTKPVKVKPENVVNAYLFYTQRLLNLRNSASLIDHKADQMAMTASICLSLKQAWKAWLEELSVYVGQSIPDYKSIFLPENSRYPEVAYLVEISQQRESWLTQLVIFFEPRLNIMRSLPDNEAALDDGSEESLAKKIRLISVDSDNTLTDEALLQRIFEHFKFYINTVRSRQAEW